MLLETTDVSLRDVINVLRFNTVNTVCLESFGIVNE
jgi:hypothetical protein